MSPQPFPGPDAPPLPPVPERTEADAVAGLLAQDARHRAAGRSICQGVCSRWYDPGELDDFGTCGTRECLRAAVNP